MCIEVYISVYRHTLRHTCHLVMSPKKVNENTNTDICINMHVCKWMHTFIYAHIHSEFFSNTHAFSYLYTDILLLLHCLIPMSYLTLYASSRSLVVIDFWVMLASIFTHFRNVLPLLFTSSDIYTYNLQISLVIHQWVVFPKLLLLKDTYPSSDNSWAVTLGFHKLCA